MFPVGIIVVREDFPLCCGFASSLKVTFSLQSTYTLLLRCHVGEWLEGRDGGGVKGFSICPLAVCLLPSVVEFGDAVL